MIESLAKLWRRIRSLLRARLLKREIDEELYFHIEQRTADNIASGMSSEDAMLEARKRFGNWQTHREECREIRGIGWLDNLFQDFRFGLRVLVKQPGSLLAALAALTLGI